MIFDCLGCHGLVEYKARMNDATTTFYCMYCGKKYKVTIDFEVEK